MAAGSFFFGPNRRANQAFPFLSVGRASGCEVSSLSNIAMSITVFYPRRCSKHTLFNAMSGPRILVDRRRNFDGIESARKLSLNYKTRQKGPISRVLAGARAPEFEDIGVSP